MNVNVINGRVFVDGKEYIKADTGNNKVRLIVNDKLVGEYTGSLDIEIDGNLQSVEGHSFTINGDVAGNVEGHNITCENVGGNVDSHNVTCGDIKGKVDAHNVMRK